MSVSTAVEYIREYGDEAHKMITKQLAKQAKKPGKGAAVQKPKFPNKLAQGFIDILGERLHPEVVGKGKTEAVNLTAQVTTEEWKTLGIIIDEFIKHLDTLEELEIK